MPESGSDEHLGPALRKARAKRGLTLRDVGSLLGVGHGMISMYETEGRPMPAARRVIAKDFIRGKYDHVLDDLRAGRPIERPTLEPVATAEAELCPHCSDAECAPPATLEAQWQVWDTLPVPLGSVTPCGRIGFLNRAQLDMLGYDSPEEVVGHHVFVLYPDSERSRLSEALAAMARGEKIAKLPLTMRHKDGSLIPVRLTVDPIVDDRGRVVADRAAIVRRESSHEVVRQAMAEHEEVEMASIECAGVIDQDGDLSVTRTYHGCQPRDVAPIDEELLLTIRERALGPKRRVSIRVDLPGPGHYVEYDHRGGWDCYELHRRPGAARLPGPFDVSLDRVTVGAYALSETDSRAVHHGAAAGASGVYGWYLVHHTARMVLRVSIPIAPPNWQAWAWREAIPFAEVRHNALKSVCSAFRTTTEADGRELRLEVDEPLIGYTFAIAWTCLTDEQFAER